jgi:hypothetical protein
MFLLAEPLRVHVTCPHAERRHIRLLNPRLKGATPVATPTRRNLLDRISELEEQNETLQTKIDDIGDILGTTEEEDEDSDRD